MSHASASRPRLPASAHGRQGQVLVLLAHPALQRSRVNAALVAAIRDLDGVTVHDLYERYPDFDIDVRAEQALLAAHRVIVWQHPFYWYSTPALLKEWQDLVLEFGWAYGPEGKALRGKWFVQAITTGGRAEAYQPEGFNRHSLRELVSPATQTARLCGMVPLPPFAVHGTHRLEPAEIQAAAQRYRALILALRDQRLDPAAVADLPLLNDAVPAGA